MVFHNHILRPWKFPDLYYLPVLYDGESLDKFADYLLNWFRFSIESISPYLLGKIFTRFYFSLKGITPDNLNLGEIFNLQILSFFNAVIVEEVTDVVFSIFAKAKQLNE